MKCLGINLTKDVPREISKYFNTMRDILCSQINGFTIAKLSFLPKLTYRFNAILIKSSNFFGTEGQLDLNFIEM